jgi:hypothetical protein
MGVKQMSHVKYQQALVENLVGDVHNPRKSSHPGSAGSAEREVRLIKAPHFFSHYEEKRDRLHCVQQSEG